MKIEIKIPDWVSKDQTLMILSGQELVARKRPNKEWEIKKVRCSNCGECCLYVPDGITIFGSDEEGKCNALKKEGNKWICTAGSNKPFRCLDDPIQKGCSIRYF